MKLYEVVEIKSCGDEFTDYIYTNVKEAIDEADSSYNHLSAYDKERTRIEVREYVIPFEVPFEIPCSYSKAYNLFEEYVEENYPEYDFANSGFACFSNGYNSIDWSSKE